MTADARVEYARQRALVELRLAELRAALARHEAERRWEEHGTLARLEGRLAALVREVSEA